VIAAVNPRTASGVSVRIRSWPLLFVTVLFFAFTSATPAQPVEPEGSLPRPPFPVRNGAVPARKSGGETSPSTSGLVTSMKLLAPDVGWAMSMGRLMWTSNGGTDWKDITPPGPEGAVTSAIFFLDASHGWVLFAHGEPDVPSGLRFDLATTDNAGATWSVEPLRMPDWLPGSLFGGEASLAFADPIHGWLSLYAGLNDMSRGYGSVLATSDGGRSWLSPHVPTHRRGDVSVAGPIVMVTPQFGWLVGGGGNDELYVTRDGAKTWQAVVLESPVKTDLMRKYDQNFDQLQRGFQALPPAAAKEEREWAQEQDVSYAAYDLPVF
jgi:photosystem II stability/assembly factor-like uncharacterized protein